MCRRTKDEFSQRDYFGNSELFFTATNPAGPWNHAELGGSLHDLSVLFDGDGKIYVVWSGDEVMFAPLKPDLSDIIPETLRVPISAGSGMGEGHHFCEIHVRCYIASANYAPAVRMQRAPPSAPARSPVFRHAPAFSDGEITTGSRRRNGPSASA